MSSQLTLRGKLCQQGMYAALHDGSSDTSDDAAQHRSPPPRRDSAMLSMMVALGAVEHAWRSGDYGALPTKLYRVEDLFQSSPLPRVLVSFVSLGGLDLFVQLACHIVPDVPTITINWYRSLRAVLQRLSVLIVVNAELGHYLCDRYAGFMYRLLELLPLPGLSVPATAILERILSVVGPVWEIGANPALMELIRRPSSAELAGLCRVLALLLVPVQFPRGSGGGSGIASAMPRRLLYPENELAMQRMRQVIDSNVLWLIGEGKFVARLVRLCRVRSRAPDETPIHYITRTFSIPMNGSRQAGADGRQSDTRDANGHTHSSNGSHSSRASSIGSSEEDEAGSERNDGAEYVRDGHEAGVSYDARELREHDASRDRMHGEYARHDNAQERRSSTSHRNSRVQDGHGRHGVHSYGTDGRREGVQDRSVAATRPVHRPYDAHEDEEEMQDTAGDLARGRRGSEPQIVSGRSLPGLGLVSSLLPWRGLFSAAATAQEAENEPPQRGTPSSTNRHRRGRDSPHAPPPSQRPASAPRHSRDNAPSSRDVRRVVAHRRKVAKPPPRSVFEAYNRYDKQKRQEHREERKRQTSAPRSSPARLSIFDMIPDMIADVMVGEFGYPQSFDVTSFLADIPRVLQEVSNSVNTANTRVVEGVRVDGSVDADDAAAADGATVAAAAAMAFGEEMMIREDESPPSAVVDFGWFLGAWDACQRWHRRLPTLTPHQDDNRAAFLNYPTDPHRPSHSPVCRDKYGSAERRGRHAGRATRRTRSRRRHNAMEKHSGARSDRGKTDFPSGCFMRDNIRCAKAMYETDNMYSKPQLRNKFRRENRQRILDAQSEVLFVLKLLISTFYLTDPWYTLQRHHWLPTAASMYDALFRPAATQRDTDRSVTTTTTTTSSSSSFTSLSSSSVWSAGNDRQGRRESVATEEDGRTHRLRGQRARADGGADDVADDNRRTAHARDTIDHASGSHGSGANIRHDPDSEEEMSQSANNDGASESESYVTLFTIRQDAAHGAWRGDNANTDNMRSSREEEAEDAAAEMSRGIVGNMDEALLREVVPRMRYAPRFRATAPLYKASNTCGGATRNRTDANVYALTTGEFMNVLEANKDIYACDASAHLLTCDDWDDVDGEKDFGQQSHQHSPDVIVKVELLHCLREFWNAKDAHECDRVVCCLTRRAEDGRAMERVVRCMCHTLCRGREESCVEMALLFTLEVYIHTFSFHERRAQARDGTEGACGQTGDPPGSGNKGRTGARMPPAPLLAEDGSGHRCTDGTGATITTNATPVSVSAMHDALGSSTAVAAEDDEAQSGWVSAARPSIESPQRTLGTALLCHLLETRIYNATLLPGLPESLRPYRRLDGVFSVLASLILYNDDNLTTLARYVAGEVDLRHNNAPRSRSNSNSNNNDSTPAGNTNSMDRYSTSANNDSNSRDDTNVRHNRSSNNNNDAAANNPAESTASRQNAHFMLHPDGFRRDRGDEDAAAVRARLLREPPLDRGEFEPFAHVLQRRLYRNSVECNLFIRSLLLSVTPTLRCRGNKEYDSGCNDDKETEEVNEKGATRGSKSEYAAAAMPSRAADLAISYSTRLAAVRRASRRAIRRMSACASSSLPGHLSGRCSSSSPRHCHRVRVTVAMLHAVLAAPNPLLPQERPFAGTLCASDLAVVSGEAGLSNVAGAPSGACRRAEATTRDGRLRKVSGSGVSVTNESTSPSTGECDGGSALSSVAWAHDVLARYVLNEPHRLIFSILCPFNAELMTDSMHVCAVSTALLVFMRAAHMPVSDDTQAAIDMSKCRIDDTSRNHESTNSNNASNIDTARDDKLHDPVHMDCDIDMAYDCCGQNDAVMAACPAERAVHALLRQLRQLATPVYERWLNTVCESGVMHGGVRAGDWANGASGSSSNKEGGCGATATRYLSSSAASVRPCRACHDSNVLTFGHSPPDSEAARYYRGYGGCFFRNFFRLLCGWVGYYWSSRWHMASLFFDTEVAFVEYRTMAMYLLRVLPDYFFPALDC